MRFAESMIFYLLIGAGVATAVFLAGARRSRMSLLFRVSTSVIFWPLYLPVLLTRTELPVQLEPRPGSGFDDAMAQAIAQVEGEMEMALASLDGWVENVLSHETTRFRELSSAWRAQASRIREMDELLARTEASDQAQPRESWSSEASGRCRQSEHTRRANLSRLYQVRHRAHEDLMGTLSWVRELVSMIHLAKFTGAPASRAEELVAQIAAAIEGISVVAVPLKNGETAPQPQRAADHSIHSLEETIPCDYSSVSAISSPPI